MVDWKKKEQEFWSELSRGYHLGKGIRERLLHDEKILGKGVWKRAFFYLFPSVYNTANILAGRSPIQRTRWDWVES